MEREKGLAIDDEVGGSSAKQQESLGIKLRNGISIGKKGGPCTPVPSWKLEAGPLGAHDSIANHKRAPNSKHHRSLPHPAAAASTVSARKLGANLWEIQDLIPLSKMSRRGVRLRHHKEDKPLDLSDLSPLSHPDLPQSAGSLRRHVTASLIQHHKSIERNVRALQPVSPASYSSSMEVAAYNQVITPASSLDPKGRAGESGYSLKTSAELLKVLNRIWSLEEQHASNISLVKALKLELEHTRARTKELLQEQQADRREIDDLMKQVTGDKLIRKSKEQERIKAAVHSIRDELEDERRLRRRSESLHRKLAKELSEMKSAYSKALKDLERERKTHALLEDLCDEFAKGVTDYEQEVRLLKQKSERYCVHKCDRLVLHISEAWMDERLQVKLAEAKGDLSEKNTIIDRLRCEIESFLEARRSNSFNNDIMSQKDARKDSCLRRHSLESVYLNGTVSAPQDAEDEDSIGSDLHCFELDMASNDNERHDCSRPVGNKSIEKLEEVMKSNPTKKKRGSAERIKGQRSSSLQVQFEEKVDRTMSCSGYGVHPVNGIQGIHAHTNAETGGVDPSQIGIVTTQKLENFEAREGGQDLEVKQDSTHGLSHMIDNSVRKESESFYGSQTHPEIDNGEELCGRFSWKGHSITVGKDNVSGDFCAVSSPVQRWSYRHTCPDLEISECSSKLPRGVKENTLKAKLLEARLEGQNTRLKTSRGSSAGG